MAFQRSCPLSSQHHQVILLSALLSRFAIDVVVMFSLSDILVRLTNLTRSWDIMSSVITSARQFRAECLVVQVDFLESSLSCAGRLGSLAESLNIIHNIRSRMAVHAHFETIMILGSWRVMGEKRTTVHDDMNSGALNGVARPRMECEETIFSGNNQQS